VSEEKKKGKSSKPVKVATVGEKTGGGKRKTRAGESSELVSRGPKKKNEFTVPTKKVSSGTVPWKDWGGEPS